MQIILKSDHEGLGVAGEVVKVKDGFARNYLIPKGIALPATPSNLRRVEDEKKKAMFRLNKEKDQAEILEKRTEADNYANRSKEESTRNKGRTATDPVDKTVVKRFHAAVDLDPDSAALDFANISEEVLQHFTSKLEMKVKISVEIEVETNGEMDEALQRTVKENASTLKFTHAEFEKE